MSFLQRKWKAVSCTSAMCRALYALDSFISSSNSSSARLNSMTTTPAHLASRSWSRKWNHSQYINTTQVYSYESNFYRQQNDENHHKQQILFTGLANTPFANHVSPSQKQLSTSSYNLKQQLWTYIINTAESTIFTPLPLPSSSKSLSCASLSFLNIAQNNVVQVQHNPAPPTTPRPKLVSSHLIDKFWRRHTYLRISLTERCNLRCKYCMPPEGVQLTPSDQLMTTEEILRIATLFVKRGGVEKIRLTGGEPLVRKDFIDVAYGLGQLMNHTKVSSLSSLNPSTGLSPSSLEPPQLNLKTLAVTSNGILLKRLVPEMRNAGINAVNISLDSLVQPKFELITRRKGLSRVLDGIHEALRVGIPSVKINCVVMNNFNTDELVDFAKFTRDHPVDVRFIEYMPFDGNQWSDKKFFSYKQMLQVLENEFGQHLVKVQDSTHDTTKHYQVDGFKGRIGFITSMTNHFCATCNRLRITADGNLKVCLFGNAEVSLRDYIRQGATDEDLFEIVDAAVKQKHFSLGGNKDMYEIFKSDNRPMITIGG